MLTVSQVSKKVDISAHTIRYYIKIGLIKPERDEFNNYHVFSKETISNLKFVHKAKQLGFTLNEIKQFLKDAEKGEAPCPKVRKIIQQRIEENEAKIKELQAMQKRMQTAIKQWEDLPNEVPTGNSVCCLIESF